MRTLILIVVLLTPAMPALAQARGGSSQDFSAPGPGTSDGQLRSAARPQPSATPSEAEHDQTGANDNLADGDYDLLNPQPLEGTISTGRPSFSTGTAAVPIGRIQVELGYTYTRGSDNQNAQSFPNTLIRYGVLDDVELRFSTAGYQWRENADDGLANPRLGAKLEIRGQAGFIPRLAVQPSLSIPIHDASTSNEIDPNVQFAASWVLNENWALLANANIGTVSTGDDTEALFATALYLGRAVTNRLGAFGEYYAQYPGDAGGRQNLDFGLTYLFTDNIQVDGVIGFGLNDAANDLFLGTGLSFRF